MKKILTALLICTLPAIVFTACKPKIDYFAYVSDYRSGFYFYESDDLEVKVYSVERETPYSLDGIKGKTSHLTEIYLTFDGECSEAEIMLGNRGGGEMSYMATARNYYLSFPDEGIEGASLSAKVTLDGKEREIEIKNVAAEGVIDGKTALDCVREYDRERFESLSESYAFKGEISVRLLYDEGCYYYVGLCDRDKNVHAYLVDGNDGRVIAEHDSGAQ